MTAIYRPNQLEHAYASYILTTVFQQNIEVSKNSKEEDDRAGGIHVEGRDAVPFLTKSGLDRNVLRAVWNVADPEGIGTLLNRTQFHVILRLISMAQIGMLPSFDLTSSPNEILIAALQNNQQLKFSLPEFEGVPQMSPTSLIATYNPPPAKDDSLDDTPSNMSAFDLDFQKLQLQKQQKQQQQQQHTQLNQTESKESKIISISDAFGGLLEIEDKALPSSQTYDANVEESSPSGTTSNPSKFSQNVEGTTNSSLGGTFNNINLVSIGNTQITGYFGESKDGAVTEHSSTNDINLASNSKDVDSVKSIKDLTMQSVNLINGNADVKAQPRGNHNGVDEFGEFEDAPVAEPAQSQVISISDAFGGLMKVEDKVLPSIQNFQAMDNDVSENPINEHFMNGSTNAHIYPTYHNIIDETKNETVEIENDSFIVKKIEVDDENDDFGDFEDAPTTANEMTSEQNTSINIVEDHIIVSNDDMQHPDEGFGKFEHVSSASANATNINAISDAFENLIENENVTLPSTQVNLGDNSANTQVPAPNVFSNTPLIEDAITTMKSSSNNTLEQTHKAPEPFGNQTNMNNSEDFGDFEDAPTTNIELNLEKNLQEVNDNEGYGDFKDVPSASANGTKGMSISDVFGALIENEDAPLPSTQANVGDITMNTPDPASGFSNTPIIDNTITETMLVTTQVDDNQDPFKNETNMSDSEDFGDFEDAPTTDIGLGLEKNLQESNDNEANSTNSGGFVQNRDERFGDFKEGPATSTNGTNGISISDAFGGLIETEDAVLPSTQVNLGESKLNTPTPACDDLSNALVPGDVLNGQITSENEEIMQNENNQKNADDKTELDVNKDFGHFNGTITVSMEKVSDKFMQNPDMTTQHVNLEGNKDIVEANSVLATSDAFGELVGVEEKVLPPLQHFQISKKIEGAGSNQGMDVKEVNSDNIHEFGDFDNAHATGKATQADSISEHNDVKKGPIEEESDFGDFEDAGLVHEENSNNEKGLSSDENEGTWGDDAAPADDFGEFGDFGDFEGPDGVIVNGESNHTNTEKEVNLIERSDSTDFEADFVDFQSASQNPPLTTIPNHGSEMYPKGQENGNAQQDDDKLSSNFANDSPNLGDWDVIKSTKRNNEKVTEDPLNLNANWENFEQVGENLESQATSKKDNHNSLGDFDAFSSNNAEDLLNFSSDGEFLPTPIGTKTVQSTPDFFSDIEVQSNNITSKRLPDGFSIDRVMQCSLKELGEALLHAEMLEEGDRAFNSQKNSDQLQNLLEEAASLNDDVKSSEVAVRISEIEKKIPSDNEISQWRRKLSKYAAEEFEEKPHLTLDQIRSQLIALPKLPKELRPKRRKSLNPSEEQKVNEVKSFIDCFDAGVGAGNAVGNTSEWLTISEHAKIDLHGATKRRRRAELSLHLYQLLTSSKYKKNPKHWSKIISVIKYELATATMILNEAFMVNSTLSQTEKSSIVNSEKIRIYVLGLSEFVRVARFIEATIYDLFCQEESLDNDTSRDRGFDNTLMYDLREIESSWKNLFMKVKNLGMEVTLSLDTVPEIRRKRLQIQFSSGFLNQSLRICELSLQPDFSLIPPEIETKSSQTTSIIEWDENLWMACAANLWANKISPEPP